MVTMTRIVVSQEILTRLDAKLESLSGQFDDEERNLVATLLTLGAQQASEVVQERPESEVEGFGATVLGLSGATASLGLALGSGKMFEIVQDVTVNKAKTADKAFSAMDGYIRG
jgi:hypothetical protein